MTPNVVHPTRSVIVSIRVKLSRLGDYWIGFPCILWVTVISRPRIFTRILLKKKKRVLFTRKSIYYIKELMVNNCKNL